MPIELILGTGGLAAFLLWAVNELWKAHKASDERERKRADEAYDRLQALVDILEKAAKS